MRILAFADEPPHGPIAELVAAYEPDVIVLLGDLEPAWTEGLESVKLPKLGARLPSADVLLTHSPPAGVNDEPDDPAHSGSPALREWVERNRPAWLLHGHTLPHPAQRVKRLGETRVVHVRGAAAVELT